MTIQRDTQRRVRRKEAKDDEDWWKLPEAGKRQSKESSPGARIMSCQYLGFTLLTSGTVGEYVSIGLRHQVCGNLWLKANRLLQRKLNWGKETEGREASSQISGQHHISSLNTSIHACCPPRWGLKGGYFQSSAGLASCYYWWNGKTKV